MLAFTLLASPTTALAQYGGGTTINLGGTGNGTTTTDNTSSNGPKFSVNSTGDSVNINIETAKKGSILDAKIGNSSSGVFKIKFTVNTDVTNAKITIYKIDSSQLFADFPGSLVTAYAVALTNINYDQITNFSFSFKIKKSLVEGKSLLAYSSNSPWVSAGLTTDSDPSIASDEVGYIGGVTPIAFKQFGVSAANQVSTAGNPLSPVTNPTMDKANSVDLVRTGGNNSTEIVSILFSLVALIGFSFAIVKTNQNPNRN